MLMLKKKSYINNKNVNFVHNNNYKIYIYLLSYEKMTVRSTGQKLVYIKSIS